MPRRPSLFRRFAATDLFIAAVPTFARAGMPSFEFTDLARMRLQTISFFLVVFLLSAAAVRWLWNRLRRDFTRLPPLTYRRALALVGLWGLIFVLVLTMISGARELMTPGAWVKNGLTYKLADAPKHHRDIWNKTLAERRPRLEALRAALWSYADHHGGAFPPDDASSEISAPLWETPDLSRARYLYLKGRRRDDAKRPLVCEPAIFQGPRMILYTTGDIEEAKPGDVRTVLDQNTAASKRSGP